MSSRQTTTTQGTQSQSGSQSGTQSGSESGTFTGTGSNRSTNQYGWQHTPDTEDIVSLRGYRETVDPSIDAAHSRRSTNLRNSFMNPLGANTTSAIRDATQRSLEGEMEQDYGQARRQAWNDAQQRTGQRLTGLAGLTAPTLTQVGSTSEDASSGTSTGSSTGTTDGSYSGTGSNTGSSSQTTPMLPQILGAASGIGAAAL